MRWWHVVGVVYLWMSAIAFVLYGLDKRRARRDKPRIAEATLHWIELFGGWPGALIATRVFRHKSHKTRFLLVLWAIAIFHVVAWSALVWSF